MIEERDHIEFLRQYNLWRRGEEMEMPHPARIGESIDWAIAEVERLRADIAHFMHWPALVESLNCDAKMLRCKLGDHVR